MSIKTKFITFIIIVVIAVTGWGVYANSQPGKLDDFAKCLESSGAKFYGTFWCSHCQNQKQAFGSAKQYLPYIECANKDGSQNDLCKEVGIEGYPTWVFFDGSQLSGEQSLETLANKTQCLMPQ
jgi:hypothetical protein